MFAVAPVVVAGPVTGEPLGLTIDLRGQVELERRHYTLGDLAMIHAVDPALVQRMQRLQLGRTPRAGYSAVVNRGQIERRLERAIPDISQHIVWTGTEATTLQSAKVAYSETRYVTSARRYLSKQLSRRFSDHNIRITGAYKALLLPPGKVQLSPSLCSARIRKRSCIWIDVSVNGKHYRTIPVWFDVSVFANVLELTQALPAGAVVHDKWVQTRLRDVANVPGLPLQSLNQISGQRLVRSINSGTVLTRENFEPLPPVVKGQQVSVHSSVGSVTLIARARALEDGYPGRPVRLERLDGTDRYIGTVIDYGVVAVGGGGYD